MKKIVSLLLTVVTIISLSVVPALADGDPTNYAFGFDTQCVNTTTKYHSGNYKKKTGTVNYIEVRHHVIGDGSDAGFTNLMNGYVSSTGAYLGSKWQAPDGGYYCCTSNSFAAKQQIAPGGRGNTKYNEQLGLTTLRLEGQFRVH